MPFSSTPQVFNQGTLLSPTTQAPDILTERGGTLETWSPIRVGGGYQVERCVTTTSAELVFTDRTDAITLFSGTAVSAFPSGAVGDLLYIGTTRANPNGIYVDITTAGDGAAAATWEGWTGAAWVALTITDGTAVGGIPLRQDGSVTWTDTLALTTVNGLSAYWIRLRVTTIYTTNPTIVSICYNRIDWDGLVISPLATSYAPPISSTSGTYLGMLAPTGFNGNLIDLWAAGASVFSVDSTGALIVASLTTNLWQSVSNAATMTANLRLTDGGTHTFQLQGAGTSLGTITYTGNGAGGLTTVAMALFPASVTLTPGATHSALFLTPTWTSENFYHAALNISPTQNGTNTNAMVGLTVAMSKATGATTLAGMMGIQIGSPTVTGTVTTGIGIDITDQTNANITTPRAIRTVATGVSNAFQWGSSALQYANAANNIRFADSTNANGLNFDLSAAGPQQIYVTNINSANSIVLQAQTFTPAATHNAVSISPTWATENQVHNALAISATQNGANSNASGLTGIAIQMTKATGATTLAQMTGISVSAPSVTGSVTNAAAIAIQDQTNANITSPRGLAFVTTGVANSIQFGVVTGPLQYSSAANNIILADATNVGGLSITLSTTTATINSFLATTGSILLQNQTLTPGGASNAVQISPTWATENFNHRGLEVSVTQNGANSAALVGIDVTTTKATGATVLAAAVGVEINALAVTGTVSSAYGLDIGDWSSIGGSSAFAIRIGSQTANATTTRAIELLGTGVNNAIRFGSSPNLYSSGAEVLRMMDSTNARGIIYTLTAGGNQQISASAGNLEFPSGAAFSSGGTVLTNYTEGTFTPTVTLVGGAGNTVPVYSTNTGRYTRVGNRVFVDIHLVGDGGAEGAGTGTFTVALPIAASSSYTGMQYFPAGFLLNSGVIYNIDTFIAASASTLTLKLETAFGTYVTIIGDSQGGTDREVELHFSYEV